MLLNNIFNKTWPKEHGKNRRTTSSYSANDVWRKQRWGIATSWGYLRDLQKLAQCSRPRKTARKKDSLMYTASAADPYKNSTIIQRPASTKFGTEMFSRTKRRRLNAETLHGCIIQHKPHISKKNWQPRITFSREYLYKPITFWKNKYSLEWRIELLSIRIRR